MNQTFKDRLREIRPAQLIIPLVVLVIFVGALIGIINYQNKNRLNKIPTVEIVSPADGAQISEAKVVVTGNTNSKNKVKVNQNNVSVDKKGGFNTEVPLSYGDNTISVIAENSIGKKAEKSLKITRPKPVVTESKVDQAVQGAVIADGKGDLSTSGPETFWLLESAALSAAGAAFLASKKKLKETFSK